MLPQLNLFWRTFLLLSVSMILTSGAGMQALMVWEIMPRNRHTVQQLAAAAQVSRVALRHCNSAPCNAAILQALHERGWRSLPQRTDEHSAPPPLPDEGKRQLLAALRQHLEPGMLLAHSVNSVPGPWVALDAPGGGYLWLGLPELPGLYRSQLCTWLSLLGGGMLLAFFFAKLLARRLQQPLRQLEKVVRRMDKGDFSVSGHLDTEDSTAEIREVHSAFQHMAQNLEQREQERAIMLAGISHDLRTPLTRLRLETEMSVPDERARSHMIADMEQLDATINKFLDYAVPLESADKSPPNLHPVALREALLDCMRTLPDSGQLRVGIKVGQKLYIQADPVDLSRIIQNLLENARRYGTTRGTRIADIQIYAKASKKSVLLDVRDHGPGVPPEHLSRLPQAFFRTDTARVAAATGAGLGLAIVQKSMRRMGGSFSLTNASQGSGLVARLKFRRAPAGGQQRA